MHVSYINIQGKYEKKYINYFSLICFFVPGTTFNDVNDRKCGHYEEGNL